MSARLDLLLECLLLGALTCSDLCRLELTARAFCRQLPAYTRKTTETRTQVRHGATTTTTVETVAVPTLLEEAARRLAGAHRHAANSPPQAHESWLRTLQRLERGLRFTVSCEADDGPWEYAAVTLAGSTAGLTVALVRPGDHWDPNWCTNATAVCGDHRMVDGVHRAEFSILGIGGMGTDGTYGDSYASVG